MTTAADIKNALAAQASPEKAAKSMWFFKTGKGEYSAHDQFIGVTVPEQRAIAKQFRDASMTVLAQLLKSKIHEHRLTALIILTDRFPKADSETKQAIYDFYMSHIQAVNNWDLVDTSAGKIVGGFLYTESRAEQKRVLLKLARSRDLWEQRIAIIATQYFIAHDDFVWTQTIADMLMNHPHDLIHKATGWMLREMGKRGGDDILETYLKSRYTTMPRTMLRYAIERLPETRRKQYLHGTIS